MNYFYARAEGRFLVLSRRMSGWSLMLKLHRRYCLLKSLLLRLLNY